jgi:hypothetical protein
MCWNTYWVIFSQTHLVTLILEDLGIENAVLYSGHLQYFTPSGYILHTYGHFGDFVVIWYIFPRFGILYQTKSGNPVRSS